MEAREGMVKPGPRAGEKEAWESLSTAAQDQYNEAAADFEEYVIHNLYLDVNTYIPSQ
jgi:hypothetical protein